MVIQQLEGHPEDLLTSQSYLLCPVTVEAPRDKSPPLARRCHFLVSSFFFSTAAAYRVHFLLLLFEGTLLFSLCCPVKYLWQNKLFRTRDKE